MPAASPKKAIPAISLTNFVDFVVSGGTPQLTCLKEIKKQFAVKYNPAFDFYKQFRECLIKVHREGYNSAILDTFVEQNANAKKDKFYQESVANYKKLFKKKAVEWIDCENRKWESNGLTVNVNPELGLKIDGVDHVIKLYFKKHQPKKLQLETILHLIKTTLPIKNKNAVVAVIDIPRGKLIVPTVETPDIEALLAGQAAAFVTMWNAIS